MRVVLATLVVVGTAHADPAVTATTATTAAPTGLAIGVELGQPSTATVHWAGVDGRLGVSAGIGTGVLDGAGVTVRGGIRWSALIVGASPARAVPVYLGVGGRYYRHGYQPASIDELPDRHLGVEATVGAALVLRARRLELYGEAGPGYDVDRTASCSLISGVDSICPHAADPRLYLHAAIGLRWYLGIGG